jgi:hypothetical protein
MQTRIDSLMEAATNTFVGFLISLATQFILVAMYRLPISISTSLQMVGWFTVVSVARQYILRRLFNGKSIWRAIKGE